MYNQINLNRNSPQYDSNEHKQYEINTLQLPLQAVQ